MKIIDEEELSSLIFNVFSNRVPSFIESVGIHDREKICKTIAEYIIRDIQFALCDIKEESDKLEEERKKLEVDKLVTSNFIDKLKELKLTMQV